MLRWYTIFNDNCDPMGEVLAHSDDNAIDVYLDDHPACPDYLTAMCNND